LRSRVAETRVPVDGKLLSATISLGVTQVTERTVTAAQLVDDADQCLLAAKQAGRDRVISHAEMRRISAACQDPKNAAGAIFTGVKACDVMTTIVAALPSNATVGKAAKYFLRFRYSSAPVADENGKLVGFLSEKDVMNVLLWPDCWTRKIADIMKTNVVCYDEKEPILSIYEFLCRVPIRSIVVARGDRPTGIISRGTLLRWFSNLVVSRRIQGGSAADLALAPDRGQLARTAAAISQQAHQMQSALEHDDDDMTPHVIGGASRIQELVNDLLAGAQRDGESIEDKFGAASSWDLPCNAAQESSERSSMPVAVD
jgi:two-component system cell cycle response regulator